MDRPVLEIPVDDSKFKEFLAQFDRYRDALAQNPEMWAAVLSKMDEVIAKGKQLNNIGGGGASTGSAGKKFNATSSGRDDWGSANASGWARMQTIAHDAKVNGPQSFISRFRQESHLAMLDWRLIGKSLASTQKHFASIGRNLINFRKLGAFGLLGGGVVGAAMGAAKDSASDLAGKSLEAKQLGLNVGEPQAFEDVYGPALGASKDQLLAFANLKSDKQQWRYLQALDIPISDIQNKNPVDLAREAMQHAGDKYRTDPNYGMWAQQMGVDKYVSTPTARAASTMTDADWQQMSGQYAAAAKQEAVNAQALADATKATQKFKSALDTAENQLEVAFEPLTDKAADLAKAWAKDIVEFSRSKELHDDIDQAISSFRSIGRAGEWLAKELNKWIPGDTVKPDQKHDVHLKKDSVAANAVRFFDHPVDTWKAWRAGTLGAAPAVNYDWAWDTPSTPAGSDGSLASQNNNPGNLRSWAGAKAGAGGFAKFDTPEAGFRAAADNLRSYGKKGINTLRGIINRWAPSSENDTKAYLAAATKATGYGADQQLDLNDPKVLANVESAITQHESSGFRYATPSYLQGVLSGNAVAALNTPPNNVSSTDGGLMNAAADRFMQAATILRDTFREGGGSRLRSPDPAKPIKVEVYSPPGSNVAATNSTLPQ
jgi:hypothetical protein